MRATTRGAGQVFPAIADKLLLGIADKLLT
jgi:hypothetical protein